MGEAEQSSPHHGRLRTLVYFYNVYTHVVYVCACVHGVHVYMNAEARSSCQVTSQSLSTLFSETGSLTEARVHQFGLDGWLLSSRDLPFSTSPMLGSGITDGYHSSQLFTSLLGSEPRSSLWVLASTLLTEPAPNP